jgi:hypothetical protein
MQNMGKMKEISAELEDISERMDEIEREFFRPWTPEHDRLVEELKSLWRRYHMLEKQI